MQLSKLKQPFTCTYAQNSPPPSFVKAPVKTGKNVTARTSLAPLKCLCPPSPCMIAGAFA